MRVIADVRVIVMKSCLKHSLAVSILVLALVELAALVFNIQTHTKYTVDHEDYAPMVSVTESRLSHLLGDRHLSLVLSNGAPVNISRLELIVSVLNSNQEFVCDSRHRIDYGLVRGQTITTSVDLTWAAVPPRYHPFPASSNSVWPFSASSNSVWEPTHSSHGSNTEETAVLRWPEEIRPPIKYVYKPRVVLAKRY